MNSTKKSKKKRKPSEGLDRCHYPASQRQKSVFPNEPSCHFRVWHFSCLFCLSVAGLSFPFAFFTNASNAFLEGA